MTMNDINTDSGRMTSTISAERTCSRKIRQMMTTIVPCSIKVARNVATESRISPERS